LNSRTIELAPGHALLGSPIDSLIAGLADNSAG
jgi:hypothetical protein